MIPVGHRNSQQKNVVPTRAISAAEDEDSGQSRVSMVQVEAVTITLTITPVS